MSQHVRGENVYGAAWLIDGVVQQVARITCSCLRGRVGEGVIHVLGGAGPSVEQRLDETWSRHLGQEATRMLDSPRMDRHHVSHGSADYW